MTPRTTGDATSGDRGHAHVRRPGRRGRDRAARPPGDRHPRGAARGEEPGPTLRDRPRPLRRPDPGRGDRPPVGHRRLRRCRRSGGGDRVRADVLRAPGGPGRGGRRGGARLRRAHRSGDGEPAQAPAPAGRRHRHRRCADHQAPVTSSQTAPPTARAFIGLGSNLGDRAAHLRRAVDQLRGGSDAPVTAVSRVYETEPIGGPDGQGPYLNLVVELAVDPGVNPYRILEQCHRLEAAAGRVRTVRWGPRTLDADVLWIDGVVLDDPSLTIPHPRWRQRRFVMAPLGELAPDLADDEAIATAGGEVTVVGTL